LKAQKNKRRPRQGPKRRPPKAGRSDPELELEIGEVLPVLEEFLLEESGRAGFRRLVVGLSGGLDSAVSAALAVRAVGPRNVTAIMMPYRTSNPSSLAHAKLVCRRFRISSRVVDISVMVDAYFRERKSTPLRRGNKMSRERMSILFDVSQELGALVVGTSNKTEILLGYGTLFGDLASALNPIGDLYKTQVRQAARRLGVPGPILRKAPSADLIPGQTDEEDLGHAYDLLDSILVRMVDLRRSPEEIREEGWPPGAVRTIRTRLRTQQFKRRPPLIAKISQRTVGTDFRYARDWGT